MADADIWRQVLTPYEAKRLESSEAALRSVFLRRNAAPGLVASPANLIFGYDLRGLDGLDALSAARHIRIIVDLRLTALCRPIPSVAPTRADTAEGMKAIFEEIAGLVPGAEIRSVEEGEDDGLFDDDW